MQVSCARDNVERRADEPYGRHRQRERENGRHSLRGHSQPNHSPRRKEGRQLPTVSSSKKKAVSMARRMMILVDFEMAMTTEGISFSYWPVNHNQCSARTWKKSKMRMAGETPATELDWAHIEAAACRAPRIGGRRLMMTMMMELKKKRRRRRRRRRRRKKKKKKKKKKTLKEMERMKKAGGDESGWATRNVAEEK